MVEEADTGAGRSTVFPDESRFAVDMRASRDTGQPAEAVLRTDDRVLARITDGIYRQPSSALRELISNAYDADATEVYIETDAPRFGRIEIRDNGIGMDEAALARLVYHIGGSSKRTDFGKDVGTTSDRDPNLSPGGRRLIGKIGIGLFSVSQLTSHFQIITKIKGNNYRLFADVILKTYVEDGTETGDRPFDTGHVRVVSVPADDKDSQGTQIILRRLHPRARDILRSQERWNRWFDEADLPYEEQDAAVTAPVFHAGVLAKEPDPEDGELIYRKAPALPWDKADSPLVKFEKLRTALADEVRTDKDRPELVRVLDTYLSTLWTLSLSAPLEYLRKHPFDLSKEDDPLPYLLTNARGQAQPLALKPSESIRDATGFNNRAAAIGGFSVFVDGVELRRPITFEWWPSERQAITSPLIFVGRYSPDLSKIPTSVRGGDLEFEAYLFWNSKVVPKENNGVLIRINGASGALFDDTFLKYQVSEQTRLRQITAEIFVTKGIDAALNIDRESFNFAHPHYILLSNWLHRALRQLANTHKAISDNIRSEQAEEKHVQQADRLTRFAEKSWHSARRKTSERPPPVEMVASPADAAQRRQQGVIAIDRNKLAAAKPPAGKKAQREAVDREMKVKAVATILDGFGVFDDMPYDEQHRLLNAILAVFFDDAQA